MRVPEIAAQDKDSEIIMETSDLGLFGFIMHSCAKQGFKGRGRREVRRYI
tara:strand:- start:431 stop:580 length:150 start_codon:yes stop_codon:yes gene_type:complete